LVARVVVAIEGLQNKEYQKRTTSCGDEIWDLDELPFLLLQTSLLQNAIMLTLQGMVL
jgi:hypothetical protein